MSKYIKYEPCCCGANRREHVETFGGGQGYGVTLICRECGLRVSGASEYGAKKNWNRIMQRIENERHERRRKYDR